MEYVPPVGGAADDPYINANPAAAVEGSAVPAEALEHPMREIVAVIEAAGLTPDGADLTQLEQAIAAMIAASSLPVGSEILWQSSSLPDTSYGVWLEEDGSTFDAALYPELAAHLGDNVLPNPRGDAIRIYDHGRGVDTGRALGDEQLDQLQGHGHIVQTNGGSNASLSAFIATANRADTAWQSNLTSAGTLRAGDALTLSNGTPRVGNETRMRNYSKMLLIKAI